MRILKQSSAVQPLMFLMVDSTDHITGKTGLTPTVTIRKSNASAAGSFGSPTGTVREVGNGWYQVDGNATDTATLGPLVLHATGTAADPVDLEYEVVSFDPQDAVRMGLTALPNATVSGVGGLLTAPTTANTGLADVTRLLGTAWLTPGTAGTPDVNVKLWNALTTVELPLVPTTAGRKLDVSTGGEAGIDWANVGSPTTTLVLSGTTVGVVTTYTGNTPQTGDSFGRIGVAGVGLTNLGDTRIANLDATISSRASPTNITAGTLTTVTNLTNAPTAGDFTATMKTSLNAATLSLSAAGLSAVVAATSLALRNYHKIWYVRIGGNDTTGDGSAGNPYALPSKAASVAAAGDCIDLGPGVFVQGSTKITLPATVLLKGAGAFATTITTSAGAFQAAINITGAGSEVEDLGIVNSAASSAFNYLIGATDEGDTAYTTATLRRVYLAGDSDCIWTCTGSTTRLYDCYLTSKWDMLAGDGGALIELYNCTLINTGGSVAGGAASNIANGIQGSQVIARMHGGTLDIRNGGNSANIAVRGASGRTVDLYRVTIYTSNTGSATPLDIDNSGGGTVNVHDCNYSKAKTSGTIGDIGSMSGEWHQMVTLNQFTVPALVNGPGGAASDPLSSPVPGSYPTGTAGNVIGLLGTLEQSGTQK